MPNHVTSRFAVSGPPEQVDACRALMVRPAPKYHSDDGGMLFDFEQLIPMPAALGEGGAEESTSAEMGASLILYRADRDAPFADYLQHWSKGVRDELGMQKAHIADVAARYLALHPDVEAKGRLRLTAVLETGYASWYPWCIKRWGTKWGAYRYREDSINPGLWSFVFETAWSFPFPVFEALALRFPELTFDCLCYDEGNNFAGAGQFGFEVVQPFQLSDATPELYERVYGAPRPADTDDGE